MDDVADCIVQYPDIVEKTHGKRNAETSMEKPRVGRWLLLEELDSTVTYPAPDFSSNEGGKHDKKPGAYLFSKDGHCQARLGDSEPSALSKLLDFNGSQGAITDKSKAIYEATVKQQSEVDQYLIEVTTV